MIYDGDNKSWEILEVWPTNLRIACDDESLRCRTRLDVPYSVAKLFYKTKPKEHNVKKSNDIR